MPIELEDFREISTYCSTFLGRKRSLFPPTLYQAEPGWHALFQSWRERARTLEMAYAAAQLATGKRKIARQEPDSIGQSKHPMPSSRIKFAISAAFRTSDGDAVGGPSGWLAVSTP